MPSISSLPKLGVGILYNPALPDFLQNNLELLHYVEIIPDTFQIDHGGSLVPRFSELESESQFLDWLLQRRPVVAHNIGLSIGSAGVFDADYVQRIAHWQHKCASPWHSDHLSFSRIEGSDGHSHGAGIAIPIPYDREVLKLVADRVNYVQQIVPIPFLLENNVYYVNIPEQEMTEPEFLNELTATTGCGLLLDLHNLYANARNHQFDPTDFLAQLDLSRVVEIHIAGGNELAGTYTDSHAGPCPEAVWDLLRQVVPAASNLCGITFEFHESYYPALLEIGILDQLNRAREIWNRSQGHKDVPASVSTSLF
jgi:uncharacterized protein (UPF0276 family)